MEIGSPFYGRIPEIRSAPRQERLAKIRALKDEIHALDEQSTDLIEDLWRSVKQNTAITGSELLDSLKERNLPPFIKSKIEEVIERFEERRLRVEEILNEYPNPQELFEVCFGVVPKGPVKLVRAAMTLNFVLFHEKDYEEAYATFERDNPERFEAVKKRSSKSGGCALSKTLLPDSEGVFTLIKAWRYADKQRTSQIETRMRKLGPSERLFIPNPTAIHLSLPDGDAEVVYTWRSPSSFILDAKFTSQDNRLQTSILDETTNPELRMDTLEAHVQQRDGTQVIIETDLVSGRSWIKNETTDEVPIRLSCFKEELVITNKKAIQDVLTHEIQHQWNKLFHPTDPSPQAPRDVFERTMTDPAFEPKRALYKIIRFLFDRARRDTSLGTIYGRAETRGRDEILAFYREGRPVDSIPTILQGELYNYFNDEANEKLKEEIYNLVKKYNVLQREYHPEAQPVTLTAVEIENLLKEFQQSYIQSVEHACEAIKIFETCGLSRDRLTAKLYKANLHEWLMMARRFRAQQALNAEKFPNAA